MPGHRCAAAPTAATEQSYSGTADLSEGGRFLAILIEEGPETSKVLFGCCEPPGSSRYAKINSTRAVLILKFEIKANHFLLPAAI